MNNVYRCNVALDGDLGQVVVKEGVTVPELAILRFIHLPTSITNICLMGKDKYDSEVEIDRLGKIYSDEKVLEIFGWFCIQTCFKLYKITGVSLIPRSQSK